MPTAVIRATNRGIGLEPGNRYLRFARAGLSLDDKGAFIAYDGQRMPW